MTKRSQNATPPGASAINLTYGDADSTEMTAAGPATLASGLRGASRDARSGGSTYRYVRDSDGKLVARRSSSPSQHYYLFDGLGSVVGLVTTSGALANSYRYTYDPFGNQTSGAPALGNPWGYAGGLSMDDITTGTKLTKFGTRYYDPTLGRWTQRDLSGQDANPYAYVGGDPVNFVDPSGLAPWDDWKLDKKPIIGRWVRAAEDLLDENGKIDKGLIGMAAWAGGKFFGTTICPAL